MKHYELAILGNPSDQQQVTLKNTIAGMTAQFGLRIGQEIILHNSQTLDARDLRIAFAAAYFCGPNRTDIQEVKVLAQRSLPIIPVIAHDGSFAAVPQPLKSANGLRLSNNDPKMERLSTALLECVGLLRRQRRIFVSYRRTESRSAAVQLHDSLSGKGFDVFLDTHEIQPGDPFQEVLWHRLSDSDVLIMLDTPTYFGSKWTRQELGRALAKEIHILRIIWPDQTPNTLSEFSETICLQKNDIDVKTGVISTQKLDDILLATESLRSRSIAARFMSITGWLRAEVEKIGANIEGIGTHRAIGIRLADNQQVWAYPVVGIPTAELLNDIANKAANAELLGTPVLVYDQVGIRQEWLDHLNWLDKNIRSVRAVYAREAAWALAAWEE